MLSKTWNTETRIYVIKCSVRKKNYTQQAGNFGTATFKGKYNSTAHNKYTTKARSNGEGLHTRRIGWGEGENRNMAREIQRS